MKDELTLKERVVSALIVVGFLIVLTSIAALNNIDICVYVDWFLDKRIVE